MDIFTFEEGLNKEQIDAFIGPQPPCPICNDYGEYETEYGPRGCDPCNSRLLAFVDAQGKWAYADYGDHIVKSEKGLTLVKALVLGVETPSPTQYAYSRDEERYHGEYPSVEAAIDAALEDDIDGPVYVGEVVPAASYLKNFSIADELEERAEEYLADYIGWDDHIIELSPEHRAVLDAMVVAFLQKYASYNAYGIAHSEQVVGEEYAVALYRALRKAYDDVPEPEAYTYGTNDSAWLESLLSFRDEMLHLGEIANSPPAPPEPLNDELREECAEIQKASGPKQ